jgi:predicted DCC family thiol-disulfide oxidoreductase YuxK
MCPELSKPVLIYDGDCGFCRYWIARWRRRIGERIEYVPLQDPSVAERFPTLPSRDLKEAVHLILPDGSVRSGAAAVFEALAVADKRLPLRVYESVPGAAAASELGYRIIARHRPFFSRLTMMLWGRGGEPSSFAVSSWVFLRLMGVVYLAAFWSLGSQVIGLVGRNGILPASSYMAAARQWADVNHLGFFGRGFFMPTIFWFGSSDAVLRGACIGGAVLAAMLVAGITPAILLPVLWFLYLSFELVCRDFLEFQWDMLLLETGLLAILAAPLTWRARLDRAADPPRLARWLLWWLLFRLTFASGIVKLASGDPTWNGLTALMFHYETQPLPTPLAWYAHQLPAWFQKASTAGVLAIELAAPWFIVTPRRLRSASCVVMVMLQLLIALTGNYAFFNLLTIALCLTLLDDETLRRWKRIPDPFPARFWPIVVPIAVAIVTVPVSTAVIANQVGISLPTTVVSPLATLVAPFRSVNGYGLFAVMTQTRDEIVVEGSNDQSTWLPYEFKYKPGDLSRRLPVVAPHQPRLDWQMWFAALATFDTQPWLQSFLAHVLQGTPEVLDLIAHDPFNGTPPKYVRCQAYRYHFSNLPERRTRGIVWTRQLLGDYCPVVALEK